MSPHRVSIDWFIGLGIGCVRSIRLLVRVDVLFVRELENGDITRVPGYFGTTPQEIKGAQNVNLDTVVSDLATQVDNWNLHGSGFIIERLMKFVICLTTYRPLHGSSFIPTPKRIGNKHCTLNIKSNDDKCFLWSVLACLHPVSQNPSEFRSICNMLW